LLGSPKGRWRLISPDFSSWISGGSKLAKRNALAPEGKPSVIETVMSTWSTRPWASTQAGSPWIQRARLIV